MAFRIGTLNVNGLKQEKRQKIVLDFILINKLDILCVQEVDTTNIRYLREKGYRFISAGLAPDTGFIFRNDENINKESLKYETDGKVSSITWQNITLVNVHLPSGTNNFEQREEVL